MKKYKMQGGGIVSGGNAQELTESIRDKSFNQSGSVAEFMWRTAVACELYDGSHVRYDSVENFIEDLVKSGFLREE